MSADLVAVYLMRFKPLTRVIIVLCGAVLIHLTLGTYHTFGNMLPYIASFMRNCTDQKISLEQLVWVPNFQGCFPFSMIVGGMLCECFGPRIAAACGCSLMTFGVLLSSWTIRISFLAFTITYGVMFGFGQGIAYVVAVNTAINWAPNNVGLISGIVAAGFGLSSSIFAPIQTLLINFSNYTPTRDGYFLEMDLIERVPSVFCMMAVVYGAMQMLGLIVICDPPDTKAQGVELQEQLSSGDSVFTGTLATMLSRKRHGGDKFSKYCYTKLPQLFEETEEMESEKKFMQISQSGKQDYGDAGVGGKAEPEVAMKPSEVFKSSTFYCLFVTLFCCSFYGNMYYNLYKTFGETFIDDDLFMAYAFSTASIVNAISRISWGFFADRTNFQICIMSATLLATFLLLTMPFTPRGGKPLYFSWLNLMFVCLAATHALYITASVKCFGMRYKSVNYGCLILSTTLSASVLSIFCQYLLPKLGYSWAFVITAFFPFSAFLVISCVGKTPQGHRIL